MTKSKCKVEEKPRTIILRSPNKELKFSSKDSSIFKKFIIWIEKCAHYTEKSDDTYTFLKDSYLIASDLKWKRLNK